MFRVYDTEKSQWVKDNIYLNADDELFLIKKSIFGMVRIPLALSPDRYIFHKDIGLVDKVGKDVFEGDFIRAQVTEDKEVIGLVGYAHEISAYVIFVESTHEFFTLGSETTEFIEAIGNVFDGYKEVNNDDKQTLSETKE